MRPRKPRKKTRVERFVEVYSKRLIVEDSDYFDVVFGTCFANRLDSKPVWVYIVAPPGGGKSELLQALGGHSTIFLLSSFTEKTLNSGMIPKDPNSKRDFSLLPKLDAKVLVIKDFTVIIKDRRDVVSNIMGQLRDMYDGKSKRAFGTGKDTLYTSKFGILAGVTHESGRRRDCSRRPPTPPGIRFRTTAVHVVHCKRCN